MRGLRVLVPEGVLSSDGLFYKQYEDVTCIFTGREAIEGGRECSRAPERQSSPVPVVPSTDVRGRQRPEQESYLAHWPLSLLASWLSEGELDKASSQRLRLGDLPLACPK